jgi:molybdate transport system regulatory protein
MAVSIRHMLKEELQYVVRGTLWIECENERFFGPGRVELLQRIDQTGSIRKAAAEMGMSYKKAWAMVTTLNRQVQRPLVVIKVGGEKGGGSVITDEARELISVHSLLRQRFLAFLEKETADLKAAGDLIPGPKPSRDPKPSQDPKPE